MCWRRIILADAFASIHKYDVYNIMRVKTKQKMAKRKRKAKNRRRKHRQKKQNPTNQTNMRTLGPTYLESNRSFGMIGMIFAKRLRRHFRKKRRLKNQKKKKIMKMPKKMMKRAVLQSRKTVQPEKIKKKRTRRNNEFVLFPPLHTSLCSTFFLLNFETTYLYIPHFLYPRSSKQSSN